MFTCRVQTVSWQLAAVVTRWHVCHQPCNHPLAAPCAAAMQARAAICVGNR